MQNELFSAGNITNWGAHMIDIAHWGNGSDDTGPIEAEAQGDFPDRGLHNVHTNLTARATYANRVKLFVNTKWDEETKPGVKFTGDDGWIFAGRGVMNASDKSVLHRKIDSNGVKLYESSQYHGNWLECIRSRKDPIAKVEIGHRSNSVSIITHLAMKRGKTLNWDPTSERFTNDQTANEMLLYNKRLKWL